MKKTFKFYSDAGHGWMAVKREFLIELGVLEKISSYSYQRGATVYCEEDRAMTVVMLACRDSGIVVELKDGKFQDRSPIRSYDRFSVKG